MQEGARAHTHTHAQSQTVLSLVSKSIMLLSSYWWDKKSSSTGPSPRRLPSGRCMHRRYPEWNPIPSSGGPLLASCSCCLVHPRALSDNGQGSKARMVEEFPW